VYQEDLETENIWATLLLTGRKTRGCV